MADLFKEVQRIYGSASARRELDEKIRLGDRQAAETFFYFALWRGIQEDRTYPARNKPRLFRQLLKHVQAEVELHVEFTKGISLPMEEAIG